MAAGLRQSEAGDAKLRPDHKVMVHGVGHAAVGTGAISHGGEAAHEHGAHDLNNTNKKIN